MRIAPLVLLCAVAIAPTLRGQCARYEPAIVSLRGTVVTRTFPGPPNYESIERGDRPETPLLLVLDRPLCVLADSANEANEAEQDQRTIQLVADEYYATVLRQYLSRRVQVVGTLFHSHTGHHHTRVLISVKSVGPESQ